MTSEDFYLLFGGSDYYPGGGWYDFIGAFETIKLAKAAAVERLMTGRPYTEESIEWAHIVDNTSLKIVATSKLRVQGAKVVDIDWTSGEDD